MSQPYVGEVRLVGFNYAPYGWALCNGQALAISDNSALFTLIGTTYGGNGQTNFNLPNLQGRTPIHWGSNGVNTYVIGQTGGAETVAVTLSQHPLHTHALMGSSNNGTLNTPTNNTVGGLAIYSPDTPATQMNSNMVGMSGGGNQPHDNMQPYQVISWIIALFGVYPSPS
jgi:microcystin-dependent protein